MSQHTRQSSGSSSSNESELSDGWNVIHNIEENSIESITDILVDVASENHNGDQELSSINHSTDQIEIGLANHENSSDGESVEVIDHEDLGYSDESSSITSADLHSIKYILERHGQGDGSIITKEDGEEEEDNSVNPDDVELWKPFTEKFEEIMVSPWCWYIVFMFGVFITFETCSWATNIMLESNINSLEAKKRVIEIDDLPKLLNTDKYLALDDIQEINMYDYVAIDGGNNNNIDVRKSSSKEYEEDVGIYSYTQMDGVTDQDVDIKIGFDQKRNEEQFVNHDLNILKQTLINDASSLDNLNSLNTFENTGPINELNIQDEEFIDIKELDKDKSKHMHSSDLKFDVPNLGKTFKLLSDLTSLQDSKLKFGHSLMILDSLYVGLSDLELYISENSPLDFKLKKQKFKVSHGIAEEIRNVITISVDKLANNIFNKVQKLEKNIQTHWCRLQNDLDQIKLVQNHLFYDCDSRKEKRRNVDRKLTKNQNKYELDKDSVGKDNSNQIKNSKNNDYFDHLQSKDVKKQFRDLKKKQDKDYLVKNIGKNYKNGQKKKKLNNEKRQFQKQKRNKNHIPKNKSEKIDENVNKENITKKWENKQNNNVPLRYKYREQKKVIDIELNSVDKNDKKWLGTNVIENENNDNQWNIFIEEKKMDNKTILSGEWFLNSGDARSEVRWNHHRSDWVFDRAYARRNKDTSQWFFQRAWARQQCRLYPSLNWCKKTIMTLHTNNKFR